MKLRDALWLWGTRVNTLQEYGFPESHMTIGQGIRDLEIERAMMAGFLPPTEEEYRDVSHCTDLLWEMSFDDGFSFERPLAPIVALHEAHKTVKGVLLDDFSSVEIAKGAQPDCLRMMREAMPDTMELWIVVYSMNLEIPNLSEYLKWVDGVSFWVWNARDLPDMAHHVQRCHEISGRKPMNLGLYFYDFGDGRPLTIEQMKHQTEVGTDLLNRGECSGLCFLASSVMDVGLETIDWTRNWIHTNGDLPVPTV